MVLQLSDPFSGTTLELFTAQNLSNEREGQVDVTTFPTGESEETYLTSLAQDGRASIQGAVTGLRLSNISGYSSDPQTALAEWAVELESFINRGQGSGVDLDRDYRGDTLSGYLEDVQWVRRGGEPLELGYSIAFVRGEGVGVYDPPRAPTISPGGDLTLAGRTIPNLQEFSVQLQQPVTVARRTFAENPGDNDLTSDGGASRLVTITGRVEGDEAARQAFDADLTDSIGQDELVTLSDPFTGRDLEGMIQNYSATDEAGRTRLGDFAVEFAEGSK
jgi:hypothetical protein